MDTKKTKVIFRKQQDPDTNEWKYFAIFPEDQVSNQDKIAVIPFHFEDREIKFEPYGEVSFNYMLDQEIIHKGDPMMEKLKAFIERYVLDRSEVEVIERITKTVERNFVN